VKKFQFALLAMATALAIAPVAMAGSLCPNVAWTYSDGTTSVAAGSCGAVTLTISNDDTQTASLYWGSSSYGSTGLTIGSIASFNTAVTFAGATGAQPYYILDFHDNSGLFGETSGDKILMIENQSGNLSGGNMALNPATTLFDVYDDTTGTYLLGQSDVKTLDQWLALYPGLSNDSTWVGVEMGNGGSGSPATMTITGADYSATPEPSSLLLFGTGLVGFAGMLRRKLRA
jgi:hypothetical protein